MVEGKQTSIFASLRRSQGFKKDFSVFTSLSSQQIEALSAITESEFGFDIPESSKISMSAKLSVKPDELSSILRIVTYFYEKTLNQDLDIESAISIIVSLAKEQLNKDLNDKRDTIAKLFQPKKLYDFKLLSEKSEESILPSLKNGSGELDMRAVTDPRTDKILGYIPIALLSFVIQNEEGGEKNFAFQLNPKELDDFIGYLNRFKNIVDKAEKDSSIKNPS